MIHYLHVTIAIEVPLDLDPAQLLSLEVWRTADEPEALADAPLTGEISTWAPGHLPHRHRDLRVTGFTVQESEVVYVKTKRAE